VIEWPNITLVLGHTILKTYIIGLKKSSLKSPRIPVWQTHIWYIVIYPA